MIGRTNASSGGGKALAAISVTYPAGSVCTCSNGTKTLKAKDTSGVYLFLVPEAGTWTVTSTDGTNTVSKSVDVVRNNVFTIVLSYWNGELYSAGNEFKCVTGGWVLKEKVGSSYSHLSVLKKLPDKLEFTTDPDDSGIVRCENMIDLKNFNTIAVTITGNIPSDFKLYVLSNMTLDSWTPKNVAASTVISKTGVSTLNVKALTGKYYVGIGAAVSYNSSTTTCYINEVKMT